MCNITNVFLHQRKTLVREHLGLFSMPVSSERCLQAIGNQCEHIGDDCEFESPFIVDQSERKTVLFAIGVHFVCKLLQLG